MRACWLKWVGRDWSISADYIWLNYSGANNVPEIVKAANGYIYNSLRWLEMKTYSHQAVLSSDEDASYDIEFHSLSGRFTNYGAPQRLQKQSSMQKRFIWARQLKKLC